MKLRIIEDGNGDYRLQQEIRDHHLGLQWEALYGCFDAEHKAVAYVVGLVKEKQERERAKEVKRIVGEYEV